MGKIFGITPTILYSRLEKVVKITSGTLGTLNSYNCFVSYIFTLFEFEAGGRSHARDDIDIEKQNSSCLYFIKLLLYFK